YLSLMIASTSLFFISRLLVSWPQHTLETGPTAVVVHNGSVNCRRWEVSYIRVLRYITSMVTFYPIAVPIQLVIVMLGELQLAIFVRHFVHFPAILVVLKDRFQVQTWVIPFNQVAILIVIPSLARPFGPSAAEACSVDLVLDRLGHGKRLIFLGLAG